MASKTASLTIRIDPQLRDTAESVLEEVGMTISEANGIPETGCFHRRNPVQGKASAVQTRNDRGMYGHA
ncbi:MAG: hypothetical protein LBD16_02440 [Oscillospiraceae bacterium]|jgi:hypothetical protein|nr:hypothetical protein [Oscillospiraceae bacterium]